MIREISWRCQRLIFSASLTTVSCIMVLTDWQINPICVPCAKHKEKHFRITYLFLTQLHFFICSCFFAPTSSTLPRNLAIFKIRQALKGFSWKSYMVYSSWTKHSKNFYVFFFYENTEHLQAFEVLFSFENRNCHNADGGSCLVL